LKRSGRRHFDNKDWEHLKRRYKYRCVRCSKREVEEDEETWLTADHVIPIGMGGSKGILNIQPLCLKCNLIKGMTTTDYRGRKFKN